MGILFYELLTFKCPFIAPNIMYLSKLIEVYIFIIIGYRVVNIIQSLVIILHYFQN